MLTLEYHITLAQVDLTGKRITQQWRIENGNLRYFQ